MPLTRNRREAAPAGPDAADQGLFGKAGKWLGTATRVGSGFLPTSAVGGVPGAITGGAAELLAEFLEGSLGKTTLSRTAMEAGLSAIPLGRTLSAGRALKSAGKSGVMAGAGDVGRQWAQGNLDEDGPGWNPTQTGIATLGGAATGGILGKFFHGAKPEPPPAAPVVENMGGGVPRSGSTPGARVPAGGATRTAGASQRGTDNYNGGVTEVRGYEPRGSANTPPPVAPSAPRVPYGVPEVRTDATGRAAAAQRRLEAEQKLDLQFQEAVRGKYNSMDEDNVNQLDEFLRAGAKQDLETNKLDIQFQEAVRAKNRSMDDDLVDQLGDALISGEIADRKRGLVGQPMTITETMREPIRGGTRSVSQRFKAPEEGDEVVEGINVAGERAEREAFSAASPQGAMSGTVMPGAGTSIDQLLANLTDPVAIKVYANNIKKGETPRTAYKKAYETQLFRESQQSTLNTAPVASEAVPDAPVVATGMEKVDNLASIRKLLGGKGPKKPNPTQPAAAIDGQQAPAGSFFNPDRPGIAAKSAKVKSDVPFKESNVRPASSIDEAVQRIKDLLEFKKGPLQNAHPSFYDEGFDTLEEALPGATRQSTHPSFFDDSADALEIASPAKKGSPPPAAQAKLDAAEQTYEPEVLEELKRASSIYNNPDATKEAKRAAGKTLRQLSDFMEGRGKYSPKGLETATPSQAAAPADDWVTKQTKFAVVLGKTHPLDPKGERGIGSVEVILSTALGIGGAATGYAVDDDNPWEGALIGGALGAATPLAPALMRAIGRSDMELGDPSRLKEAAREIFEKLPQVQRYSMLMGPNLPANAFIGPWGSVVTGAIEGILKGDPRAMPLLKEAWNPAAFAKQAFGKGGREEAFDRIRHGELGRDAVDDRMMQTVGDLSTMDKALMTPGLLMTAGDSHARNLLERYGYTLEEAKAMTMTGEPQAIFTKGIANLWKGSWLGNMLLPFKRTPANILEQGSQRTPLLGSIVHSMMKNDVPIKHQAIEQAAGLGVGAGSYAIAANNSDKTSRRRARAYVTNFAGRYGLPATIGYMLGDASAEGNSLSEAMKDRFNWDQALPLPTTEPAIEFAKAILPKDNKQPIDYIPKSMQMRGLRGMLGLAPGLEGIAPSQPRSGTLRRVRRAQ